VTERSPRHRTLVGVAGWLGAAALATGVTLAAVSSIGTGIFGSSAGPLDRAEIDRALSAQTVPAEPSPTGTAEPSPTGTAEPSRTPAPTPDVDVTTPAAEPTVITTEGGTMVARCAGGLVELLSWSPAQGYRVERADRGPDSTIEVEFESSDREVEVEIHCEDGVPESSVEAD
jgi:hypothetical protein